MARSAPRCPPLLPAALLAALLAMPAAAETEAPLAPAATLTVRGGFAGKSPDRRAKDLSGIACRPRGAGDALECLVVNDENRAAQRATLRDGVLSVGAVVPLIGTAPPAAAHGRPPDLACPGGTGAFAEFDGEGVAYSAAGSAFFVIGSHGCSRRTAKLRLSSFLLARLPVWPDGRLGPPELSWRVTEVLRSVPELRAHLGERLDPAARGLNIEGLAAVGDRLLLGFRAPSLDGWAFLLGVPVAALLSDRSDATPALYRIALGRDAGIRDLAALPDGRLLVLSGPAEEQGETPYAIHLTAPPDTPGVLPGRRLAVLQDIREDGERAKAEAITVIGQEGDTLRVLVLFDGLRDGGPREYRLRP